jgi:hypothetical protein
MARGRVSCTVDGTKFQAVEATFEMNTQSDQAGMPTMQTFNTTIHIRIDLHDTKNFPFSNIQKIFNLGNVPTREKIKDLKLEFWEDDDMKNVICSYQCKAWVKSFRTSNTESDTGGVAFNNILDVVFMPVVNQSDYKEIKIGN